jgi:hypothetical protein
LAGYFGWYHRQKLPDCYDDNNLISKLCWLNKWKALFYGALSICFLIQTLVVIFGYGQLAKKSPFLN